MDKKVWLSGIMGLVVGDACGVPVEFKSRLSLEKDPVTEMRKFGSHNQPKGRWSDDSSMALANLKSLHEGYDLKDIAEQFVRWNREALFTPFGEVFDMGATCANAILRYQDSKNPYTCGENLEQDNGNGSLMRILPMCLYAYEQEQNKAITEEKAVEMVHEVSALTHAHLRSKMACGLYYFCVKAILNHAEELSLEECLQKGFDEGFSFYQMNPMNLTEVVRFGRLTDMAEFKAVSEESIKASGYVLDALEAAIWSLLNTDFYETCILKAVNLGDDTDTVAAIAGGMAGLYYGYDDIPEDWKNCIIKKDWIEELCDFSQEKDDVYIGPVVDCHSHFMPGIDDGSESMEMTMDMLHMATDEGVTDFILTSHGDYVCEIVEQYHRTYEEMKKEAASHGITIQIYEGCEIFCDLTTWDFEADNDDIKPIISALNEGLYPTYNGTKYVLIEFDLGVQPAEALYMVKRIQSGGYLPVLAHVERYPFLIGEHFVENLVREGCLVQINAYSLQEEAEEIFEKNAKYLLGKGLVHFVGSDAHQTYHRPPKMKSGVQYVWETCDTEYAKDIIYRNAYRYLLGKEV